MYKKALARNYRWLSVKGPLSVEALFDLPLQHPRASVASLENVAQAVHRKLKTDDNISFVDVSDKSTEIRDLELKLEIVKDIIKDKQDAASRRADAAKLSEQKLIIRQIIAKKKNDALEGESIEDLEKRLQALA